MRAAAGDWSVTGDDGTRWSVGAAEFESSYAAEPDGRWRRTGLVHARKAHPGEVVQTLEGEATAKQGDWIVRGQGGEQWPVPDGRFRASYVASSASVK
jgi:hypothetical protein